MANNIKYALVPELGDMVEIQSSTYGKTVGQIIYYGEDSMRVWPTKGRPVSFNLNPETYAPLEEYGITSIKIYSKRIDPHFAVQLGAQVGDMLDIYNTDGELTTNTAIVSRIIITDDIDAIVLSDGQVLNFEFIGTPEGIELIVAHPPPVVEEDNSELPIEEVKEAEEDQLPVQPLSLLIAIPENERIIADTYQRADMFASLIQSEDRQTDPRVIAKLYRITDVLMHMKNSLIVRNTDNQPLENQKYVFVADTLGEALKNQPTREPLPALLPVAAVKKIIYTDDNLNHIDNNFNDVFVSSDMDTVAKLYNANANYAKSAAGGNQFINYLTDILGSSYVERNTDEATDSIITMDQDVLRSVLPAADIQGLPSNLPAARGNDNTIKSNYVANINNGLVRLLTPSQIDIKVGKETVRKLVAMGDTADNVGYVVLTPELYELRSRPRSSVLLWDIQTSEKRNQVQPRVGFYTKLRHAINTSDEIFTFETNDLDTINEPLSSTIEPVLKPELSYINQNTLGVLDAYGLKNLEWTDEILELLNAKLDEGQKAWREQFNSLHRAGLMAMTKPSEYPMQPIVKMNQSVLSNTILEDKTMQSLIADLTKRETTFDDYDLVYANDLYKSSGYTLGWYWYALASGLPTESAIVQNAKQSFVNEYNRQKRITALTRELNAKLEAQPVINTCPHVKELERIYGKRDDATRMAMLGKFVEKYKGGQNGNFITCGVCNRNLVCKHEILLKDEFNESKSGHGEALHKKLLLEFGNGVFEGAYICKVCGQKIRAIEYDTHLEFDDEGRPLMGRTVIAETEEDDDEGTADVSEDESKKIFETDAEKAIYTHAMIIFRRIGMNPSIDVYKRVVAFAKQLINTPAFLIPRTIYKGKDDYDKYDASTRLGIIGGLVLLEFQLSDEDIPIPLTGRDIIFTRSGFPLETREITKTTVGAVTYVSHGLSGIVINEKPWKDAKWLSEAMPSKRMTVARTAILDTITSLLQDARTACGEVTTYYEAEIQKKREKGAAVSFFDSDKLPAIFRPLLTYDDEKNIVAIGNVATLKNNVRNNNTGVDLQRAVTKRSKQLSRLFAGKFSEPKPASQYSVGSVVITGLGTKSIGANDALLNEYELLASKDVGKAIESHDPTKSAGVYMKWKAPVITSELPKATPEIYYKLFFKNCASGDNYGLPHEYSMNNACRHCGFELPTELLYPIGSQLKTSLNRSERDKELKRLQDDYEHLIKGELTAVGAYSEDEETYEPMFKELEKQIRLKKQIHNPETIKYVSIEARLKELLNAETSTKEAVDAWNSLLAGLDAIKTNKIPIYDTLERQDLLNDFSRSYTALKNAVTAKLKEHAAPEKVDDGLTHLFKLIENVEGGASARELLQLFVVDSMCVVTSNVAIPKAKKWVKTITQSHETEITDIWSNNNKYTVSFITKKGSLKDDGNEMNALSRLADWMSGMLTVWIDEFRQSDYITNEELVLIMKWIVMTGIKSLITDESADKKFLAVWIMTRLELAKIRMNTYSLTQQQIEDELNKRAEDERRLFIEKFNALDEDMKGLEMIKKRLKIGNWNVKAGRDYDPMAFERERTHRSQMRGMQPVQDGAAVDMADVDS